ncbi:MAG: NAD(P)H-dependent oxidoreductase [Clostridia bacterium]|nr:NAD(P)H-dependent oxidoreductase [Clostridia bacterium]MBN2882934.1 NAD(P)H-dependent oxidoreductase [Clostridia bacterium]
MKLAIINGSPRGRKSNSNRITEWMTSVMSENTEVTKVFAVDICKNSTLLKEIQGCDSFLVIFPLYTDAMPGITKELMESMYEYKNIFLGKQIYFIIHSGFPEASQSIVVEKYTKLFASLMGMKYSGGIRMGGSEALQIAPDNYFGKKKLVYEKLARNIENLEPFDYEATEYLSRTRKRGVIVRFILNHMNLNGMYWDRILKVNGVYERRFDRPYEIKKKD